jgi:hypothetical protein
VLKNITNYPVLAIVYGGGLVVKVQYISGSTLTITTNINTKSVAKKIISPLKTEVEHTPEMSYIVSPHSTFKLTFRYYVDNCCSSHSLRTWLKRNY